ncbi:MULTISPECIES: GerAB/ArcD/ProY family transporter [Lysinibacillus]|uniref:Spore germination protein n=1 Tax=Lysinibacillus fusiformis TaxID=28031 RepID=A0A2I0UYZ2_9BACI|nr:MULTISPECIES: GerAB/ArcD/ProY family transporter [Lysinibacillus]KUF37400.1 hypothetical protein AK833_00490 [Lysinibacillus sp. F5]MEE3806711.1 GerAB/ArcD/ProY family transporter [Lysinibacillus fusiformis]PKU51281.1 hypothetical protein CRI88_11190 [Lysinibacillus fusiformis]SCY06304.1 Spore germination protein [Lysinibacillus sp. SG9]SDB13940.1 Spore germination protein [Lysinibacillus sp. TC-37]
MTHRFQIGIVFFIIHLSFGFLLYPDLIYSLTDAGHWLVILCQGVLQLMLISLYIKGLNFFPNQDIIDIYLKMGRLVAFIILLPFVLNLTVLVALNIRTYTEVINSLFLLRTPHWPIALLLYFISAYTATKGLGTILRSSVFIFFMITPFILFIIVSSIVNFDFHNGFPIRNSSFEFLLDIHFYYLIGFSAFLFLGFMVSKKPLVFRDIFIAWFSVIMVYLAFVYIPLFIFGQETVVTMSLPFVVAVDSVDIRWLAFNRQTMFFGISSIGFMLIFNAVMLWMISQIMQKLFSRLHVKSAWWIMIFSLIGYTAGLFIPNQVWTNTLILLNRGAQVYFMLMIPVTVYIYGIVIKRKVTNDERKSSL